MTRGYRNNNPGNIVKTSTKWRGEVDSDDPKFKKFSSMGWGYAAIFTVLNSYINRGVNTIEAMINTYAPPVENSTDAYIAAVVKRTGISKDTIVSFANLDAIKSIVGAISKVENGVEPDYNQVNEGYNLYRS